MFCFYSISVFLIVAYNTCIIGEVVPFNDRHTFHKRNISKNIKLKKKSK